MRLAQFFPKLDVDYFAKQGFWSFINFGLISAKGFLLSIILARFLPKEVYGQYTFIFAALPVLGTFALAGMGPAITQAVARKFDGTYFFAVRKIFKYSVIGIAGLLGLALYHQDIWLVYVILALVFPLYAVGGQGTFFLHGKNQFSKVTGFTVLHLVFLALLLAASLLYVPTLLGVVLAVLGSQLLVSVYVSLFYVRKFIRNKKVDKENLVFGKKISLIKITDFLMKQIDVFLVTFFLGFEAVAIYSIVLAIPRAGLSVLSSFRPVIFNKLIKYDLNKKHIGLFLLASLGMFIIVFLVQKFLFGWIYPTYAEYGFLALISSLFVLTGFADIFYQKPLARKDAKTYYKMSFAFYVLSVITYAVMIPFGLLYAVVAKVIFRFIYFSVGLYFQGKV